MREKLKKRTLSLSILFFLAVFSAASQDRAALVIGNASYSGSVSPLANPLNDAQDVGRALEGVGFQVMVRTDLNLEGMEEAIEDFITSLEGKSVALIYYSGHGIQVEGQNYLIPVNESIGNQSQVKSRSVGLTDLLERITEAGVSTLLVFLDSCRDNPYPGANRGGGTRGLSPVTAPKISENLIAFAAEPGAVASDGTGRNGTFTEAFLKSLAVEGRSLGDMMTEVRAEVMEKTNGVQRPRVDSGLIKPFYFITPEMAQVRANAEAQRIEKELAAINEELTARAAKIASAKSSEDKDALERDQLKQAAFEAAKKLELQNAQRESEKLTQENASRLAQQVSLKRLAESENARLASLKAEADIKRKEYEAVPVVEKSVNAYLRNVSSLDASLKDIEKRYSDASAAMTSDTNTAYLERQKAVAVLAQYRWESNKEYNDRKTKETRKLEEEHVRQLNAQKVSLDVQREASEQGLKEQLQQNMNLLVSETFTVKGNNVKVVFGEFDRDAKSWPVTVRSIDPSFPYSVSFTYDIKGEANIGAAFDAVDKAVQTNAYTAEIDHRVVQKGSGNSFNLAVTEIRIINVLDGTIIRKKTGLPEPKMYAFTNSQLVFLGSAKINSSIKTAKMLVPLQKGMESFQKTGDKDSFTVPAGEYKLLVKQPDDIEWVWSQKIKILPLETYSLDLPAAAEVKSIKWQIKQEEVKQADIQTWLLPARKNAGSVKLRGWTGVVGGGIGGITAGVMLYLAKTTYDLYLNATTSDDLKAYGDKTDLYKIISLVSASISGLGLGYGGLTLMNVPNLQDGERQLQESITRLQKLKFQQIDETDPEDW
ncbi:MAG: caspase family protein [Spirochaetes bacterium]|nr:caspase family protein [Spirochaetota bacterium]